MRCPLCDVSMREVERRGVRIDVCPECRGIWLDRGELEKLLAAEPETRWGEPEAREAHGEAGGRLPPESYKRKKKGWLSDLFDFDLFD